MRSRSPKKLFTLIEMMLVIGIIAILAAIAVPNLIEAQEHAKETAVLSEMNAIQVAQEIFFVGDKDNDGVSDYGTLQELIDANLIDPTFVKSERDGFGRALVRQLEALFGAKIGAGLGAGLSVGFLEIAPKLTQAELDALAKAEAEAKAKAEAEADAKAKAEAEAKADDPALKADDPVLKADDPVLKTDDPVLKTDDPIVKAADSDVAAGFDDLGPGDA